MPTVLLTVQEVASLLHTNKTYVYGLIKKGFLPALQMGRYKVRPSDLESFIDKYMGKNITKLDNVRDMEVEEAKVVI